MKRLKLKFYSNKTKKKTYNNNYFRYKSLQEVKRKLELGEAMSGFTLESTGNGMLVMFGDDGKKVNIIHINKLTLVEKRKE